MALPSYVNGRLYFMVDNSQCEDLNLQQAYFIYGCLAYCKFINEKHNFDLNPENESTIHDMLYRYIIKDYDFDNYNDYLNYVNYEKVQKLERHFKKFKRFLQKEIKKEDFSFWNLKEFR